MVMVTKMMYLTYIYRLTHLIYLLDSSLPVLLLGPIVVVLAIIPNVICIRASKVFQVKFCSVVSIILHAILNSRMVMLHVTSHGYCEKKKIY